MRPIYLLAAFFVIYLSAGCTTTSPARIDSALVKSTASPVDLHTRIKQVYNFEPHALDEKQLDENSTRLDKFWDEATREPTAYAAALRKELADFSNPPFFLFDGSRLLLSLSKEPLDRKIVLAAVARCDLRDIQPANYLWLVHAMAIQNEDTTEAAFHILQNPKFTVFVPQHALTLGQNFALIYMLFPADPDRWLSKTIDRLNIETDETAQKSLLLVLWYAQVPEADKAITQFSKNDNKPAASQIYAKELSQKNATIVSPLPAQNKTGEHDLRQTRRQRMKSISDEALLDFDRITREIIAHRKQPHE